MATVPDLNLFSDSSYKRSFSSSKSKTNSLAYTSSTSFSKQFNHSFGRDFYFEEATKFLERKKGAALTTNQYSFINKTIKDQDLSAKKGNKKVQFQLQNTICNMHTDSCPNQQQRQPNSRFYSIQKENLSQDRGVLKVVSQPIFHNVNQVQKNIKVGSYPIPFNPSSQFAPNALFNQGSNIQKKVNFVHPQITSQMATNGQQNRFSNANTNALFNPSNPNLKTFNNPQFNTKENSPIFHSFGKIPSEQNFRNSPKETANIVQKAFKFNSAELSKKSFQQTIRNKFEKLPKFLELFPSSDNENAPLLEDLELIKKDTVQIGQEFLKQLDGILKNYQGPNQNKNFGDRLGKIIKEQ